MGYFGELGRKIANVVAAVEPRLTSMRLDEGPGPERTSAKRVQSGTPQNAEDYIRNAWVNPEGVFGDDPVTLGNFGAEGAQTLATQSRAQS